MPKSNTSQAPATRHRQIVGFSLPPDLAAKVKVEAAQRKLSLRNLFQEMWTVYQQRPAARRDAS
jgi:hypothetical protein